METNPDRIRPSARDGSLMRTLSQDFDPIAVILSPPRCGSTVLARSLWQHSSFRWYLHEPFDWTYHSRAGHPPEPVDSKPIDRRKFSGTGPAGNGLVIKEITFQAGDSVCDFKPATLPVIFLVRDPRLAVLSRMRQLARNGANPAFPEKEAGWTDLMSAIDHFRATGTAYLIVDISDLRRDPATALRFLCKRLGLEWDSAMLSWDSLPHLRLGNIGGAQDSWYRQVLTSTGWEGPDSSLPSPEEFKSGGMSTIVSDALEIYHKIRKDPLLLELPGL